MLKTDRKEAWGESRVRPTLTLKPPSNRQQRELFPADHSVHDGPNSHPCLNYLQMPYIDIFDFVIRKLLLEMKLLKSRIWNCIHVTEMIRSQNMDLSYNCELFCISSLIKWIFYKTRFRNVIVIIKGINIFIKMLKIIQKCILSFLFD